MACSLRSKQFPLELATKETQPMSKKLSNKKSKPVDKNLLLENEGNVRSVSKQRLVKGNLNVAKSIFSQRLPVLRDRTNLSGEPLKVDVLVKKGTVDESKKPPPLTTRRVAKTANLKVKSGSKENSLKDVKIKNKKPATRSTRAGANKFSKEIEETNKVVEKSRKKTENAKNLTKFVEEKNLNIPNFNEEPRKKSLRQSTDEETANHPSVPLEPRKKLQRKSAEVKITKVASMSIAPKKKSVRKSAEETIAAVQSVAEEPKRKMARKSAEEKVAQTPSVAEVPKNKLLRKSAEEQISTVQSVAEIPKKKSLRISAKEKISVVQSVAKEPRTKLARKSAEEKITQTPSVAEVPKKKSLRKSADTKTQDVPNVTEEPEKKFFKNKGKNIKQASPGVKTQPGKPRAMIARMKAKSKLVCTSFRLRQPTLIESVSKQTQQKDLRPRAAAKNYCETTIINKNKTPETEGTGNKKVPVYKWVKLSDENAVNDKKEIYEFQFDSNDSAEKKKKTRKKKKTILTGKAKVEGSTLRKRTIKKSTMELPAVSKAPKMTKVTEEEEPEFPPMDDKPMDTDDFIPLEMPQSIAKKSKPIIVETKILQGDKQIDLKTPKLQPDKLHLRPGNLRASIRYKTMMNHALLNKSLSPITKAGGNFDPGSPWRAPSLKNQDFSRVKNVVQSTPQVAELATQSDKPNGNLESTNVMKEISESNDEVNNVSPQVLDKPTPKKALAMAKSPRKFGTEISNINDSSVIVERNEQPVSNEISPRKEVPSVMTTVNSYNVVVTDAVVPSTIFAPDFNDIAEDKENSAPIVSSPTKSQMKTPRKTGTKSPLRVVKKLAMSAMENCEIQPGPSGLQKRSLLGVVRNLSSINENVAAQPGPSGLQKRSSLGTLRNSSLSTNESIEPQPGPSGLQKRSSLEVMKDWISTKENIEPQPGPSGLQKRSPLGALQNTSSLMGDNFEPQLGPSGLQKRSPLSELRPLRQANLRNFLQLQEKAMPTTIKTPHGIFNDAPSTPINGKPLKKINTEENLQNAFGFDEDSDTEVSPIKIEPERQAIKTGKNNTGTIPARISVNEIKRHLLPVVQKAKPDNVATEKVETERKENHTETLTKQQQVEVDADFINTFDVPIEEPETKEKEVEVSLFVDLEPVHFKQVIKKRIHFKILEFLV